MEVMEKSYSFSFSRDERRCLKEKDIPYMRYSGRYIIEDAHFDSVLECLGTDRSKVELSTTETEGLINVERKFVPDNGVEFISWDGAESTAYKNKISTVLKTFGETIGKPICLDVPHNRCVGVETDSSKFHVHIWSSPKNNQLTETPEYIYGKVVSCKDNPFRPTGMGEVIITPEGFPVAEVFENDLYIHYDLCHEGDSDSLIILNHILEDAFNAREVYLGRDLENNKRVILNGTYTPFTKNVKEVLEKENIPSLFGKDIVISDYSELIDPDMIKGDYLEITFNFIDHDYQKFKAKTLMGYKIQKTNLQIPNDGIFDVGVMNTDSDDIIAQVTGNTMNILVYNILSKQKGMVVRILQAYHDILNMDSEEREHYDKKINEQLQQGSIESFIKVLSDSRLSMLKDQQKSIDVIRGDISKHQKEIVDMTRNLTQTMISVEALSKDKDWVHKKIHTEMNAMRKNKNVLRVEVVGEKLHVLTKIIYCKHGDKYYEIGAFNITMNLRNRDQIIHFKNLTRVVNGYRDGMQAPHVFPEGNPCLGSIGSTLPELIGQCEYAVALDLAIQFLQSVNTADSAGSHINKWPVVSKPEVK